ncbi:MAG: hypothetical protein ABH832_01180 [bacterium]
MPKTGMSESLRRYLVIEDKEPNVPELTQKELGRQQAVAERRRAKKEDATSEKIDPQTERPSKLTLLQGGKHDVHKNGEVVYKEDLLPPKSPYRTSESQTGTPSTGRAVKTDWGRRRSQWGKGKRK